MEYGSLDMRHKKVKEPCNKDRTAGGDLTTCSFSPI